MDGVVKIPFIHPHVVDRGQVFKTLWEHLISGFPDVPLPWLAAYWKYTWHSLFHADCISVQ
jgi:hypothetical protein